LKNRVFINGIGAVTPQGIWRPSFFEEAVPIDSPITAAIQPSYKALIPPALIRRMSRGIKMGIFAAQQALDEAGVSTPEAIIVGTGLGCSEDSEKFLRTILDNDEQFLTPTSFIQSTHNTVAAQIALRLACQGYNFTYVNRSVSFESGMLDAMLQIHSGEVANVLVGGVDEISDHTYSLLQRIGYIKPDGVNESIKTSQTQGVNYAEGATFFLLSGERTAESYAELVDVHIINSVGEDEITATISGFLQGNGLTSHDIDIAILGINGDKAFDSYYFPVQEQLTNADVLYYKHLIGQYDSCSAFAPAVAATVAKHGAAQPILRWQGRPQRPVKNILLYNQYRGKDHSLLLVRTC